jgi:Fe-S cluster assembly protein SufD
VNADLAARRRAGADAYAALPNPTETLEHWRYVDAGFDLDLLDAPATPGEPLPPGPFLESLTERSGSVTILDGHVVSVDVTPGGPPISRFGEVPDGSVAFASALAAGMDPGRDRLVAASLAHGDDGVLIHVPRSTEVATPVVVDVQAVTAGGVSYPHIAIRVDDLARAKVVVVLRSARGVGAVVPRIDASVGDGSGLDLVTVQAWDDSTRATTHERFVVGRDGTVRIGEAGLGGGLARIDLRVDLEGDGSSADLAGLSFGDGNQTLDYRVVMRHVGRNTSSNVFLKGAVGDHASSVFTGLLRIEEDAVRTSAFETNRNLVLSGDATARSVPNLEILCDDVVCGHGSTVGPLEAEHLYYLMSRGLPRRHAERVLVRGFFEEVIERLTVGALAEPIRAAVRRKYEATGAGSGR